MKTAREVTLTGIFALLALPLWLSAGWNGLRLTAAPARAQDSTFDNKQIVPFVPAPHDVVDKMIELAAVKTNDAELVKESQENVGKAGVFDRAEIRRQDILTVDLSPASVATMYLLPDVNLKLRPNLLSQLEPGSRVVSHSFDRGDSKPDKTEGINGRAIHLWIIPAKGR